MSTTGPGSGFYRNGPPGWSQKPRTPAVVNDTCVGGPTFLAERKAKVVNDVTINRSLAAWDVGGLAAIGRNGFMSDGTTLIGDRVKLGPDTSVADVRGNLVVFRGAEIRGTGAAGSAASTGVGACGGALTGSIVGAPPG